jgi:hypothetical protein
VQKLADYQVEFPALDPEGKGLPGLQRVGHMCRSYGYKNSTEATEGQWGGMKRGGQYKSGAEGKFFDLKTVMYISLGGEKKTANRTKSIIISSSGWRDSEGRKRSGVHVTANAINQSCLSRLCISASTTAANSPQFPSGCITAPAPTPSTPKAKPAHLISTPSGLEHIIPHPP